MLDADEESSSVLLLDDFHISFSEISSYRRAGTGFGRTIMTSYQVVGLP